MICGRVKFFEFKGVRGEEEGGGPQCPPLAGPCHMLLMKIHSKIMNESQTDDDDIKRENGSLTFSCLMLSVFLSVLNPLSTSS